MADYDSGLPVRSESDGADERVQTKLVGSGNATLGDAAVSQTIVDTDGNMHAEAHGNNPAGGDEALRLSELGAVVPDGVYDGTNNTDPGNMGLVGMVRNASPADSQQTLRLTAVADGSGDTRALDTALHDEAGEPYTAANPLPVAVSYTEGGTRLHDFDQAVAIVKDATDDHEISVADGDTFNLCQVWASASGKMKVEVYVGDGAAVEAFALKFVGFNSSATPNVDMTMCKDISVVGTANTTTLRIRRTNLDNQAQNLYSTIVGVTV